MTRKTGAPLPPPRPADVPRTPSEEAAYQAEVAAYRARIEACKKALRILAYGHHQPTPHTPRETALDLCACIEAPLDGYGATELSAAWQEFASEGEEPLPGAVHHHTPDAEATARAAQPGAPQPPTGCAYTYTEPLHLTTGRTLTAPTILGPHEAHTDTIEVRDADGRVAQTVTARCPGVALRTARAAPDLGAGFL